MRQSWLNDPELGPIFQGLLRLRDGGFDSMKALEKLAERRPESAEIAWKVLIGMEGQDNPGICCRLYRVLLRLRPDFDSSVETEWPTLAEQSRVNIAYAANMANLMSLDVALRLFNHPNSVLHEKRVLINGLALSAHERQANPRIIPILIDFKKLAQMHRNDNGVKFADDWINELQQQESAKELSLNSKPSFDYRLEALRDRSGRTSTPAKSAKKSIGKSKSIFYIGFALAVLGGLCLPGAILVIIIGFLKLDDQASSTASLARSMVFSLSLFLATLLLFVPGVVLIKIGKRDESE